MLALLLALFALIADRFEIRTPSGLYVAGSMPVFVLVAVLFGPAPAAALGAIGRARPMAKAVARQARRCRGAVVLRAA